MMHDMQLLRTYSAGRGWTKWKTSERITMPKGYLDRPGLFLTILFSNAILSQSEDVYPRP